MMILQLQLVLLAVPALVVLSGCPAQETRATRPSTDTLDRILRTNVRDQRVDYLNIRKRHWQGLNDYLEALAKLELDSGFGGSRDERLATLINLYNATMIKAVIERLHVGYSPSEGGFSVFKEKLVRTRDTAMSLNDLENEIIRRHYKDPRIHVALVCGAASCPPLLPRAYRSEALDSVLEDNMRAFINDKDRNIIDVKGHKLRLSQIFNWYAQDFGGKSELVGYVQKYVTHDLTGFQVSFLEYAWTLNLARPAGGKWIRTLADKAPLYKDRGGTKLEKRVRKGSIFELILDGRRFIQVDDPLAGRRLWVNKLAVGRF